VLVCLLGFIGCAEKNPVVVRVGDEALTLSEYEFNHEEYTRRKFHDYPRGLTREEFLDEIAFRMMVQLEGYKRGLQEDPFLQRALRTEKKHLLLKVLGREEVGKQVTVSEDEIRRHYDRLHKEIKIRHILVKTLNEAEEVRRRLMGGEPFDGIAREVSMDTNSAVNGGDLGYVPWGKMVSPLNEIAFSLEVNQISEPVKSEYGYHIIRIDGIRMKGKPSFEEERDRLYKILLNEKKEEKGAAYLDSISRDFHFRYNEDGFERLLDLNKNAKLTNTQLYDLVDTSEYPLVILSYDDTTYTIGDYIEELRTYPFWKSGPIVNDQFLRSFIEGIIMEYHMADEAQERGLDQDPFVKRGLRKKRRDLIFDAMYREEVFANIHVSEEEKEEYYEEHREDFFTPMRVRAKEIVVATEEEARRAYERVTTGGEAFEEVAVEVSISRTARYGGIIGTFTRDRFPEIGEVAFLMNPGEISEPFATDRGYVIVKVVRFEDESYVPLEQVKRKIEKILSEQKEKLVREDYRKQLLKKYDVYVDYGKL
jgi:parvulin-like peptidyl-prolyl isomerase